MGSTLIIINKSEDAINFITFFTIYNLLGCDWCTIKMMLVVFSCKINVVLIIICISNVVKFIVE